MYEILKQFEFRGEKYLSVEKLRFLLGISANAYPKFSDFRRDVLEKARKALEDATDITFLYDLLTLPTPKGGGFLGSASIAVYTVLHKLPKR